mmetsp:Transcript_107722/g.300178  ORF Transcript_107722/g.300178 Transcript_107722/m.300178 type:complete len:216 (+) Transcript_107722:450-1097(+)
MVSCNVSRLWVSCADPATFQVERPATVQRRRQVIELFLHRPSCLQGCVDVSANVRQAVNPARHPVHAQAPAEVVCKVAAVPPQEVIVVPRVIFEQLRRDLRDFSRRERCPAAAHRLAVAVARVLLRLAAPDAIPRCAIPEAEAPLQSIDLDACVEDAAQLQWRKLVCQDAVQRLDAWLVRDIVNMQAYRQAKRFSSGGDSTGAVGRQAAVGRRGL